MDNIVFFIVYGFILIFALAWLWAFFRIASDTLMSMISVGVFNLRSLGWSAFCALLALIPLFIVLAIRGRFEATFPG